MADANIVTGDLIRLKFRRRKSFAKTCSKMSNSSMKSSRLVLLSVAMVVKALGMVVSEVMEIEPLIGLTRMVVVVVVVVAMEDIITLLLPTLEVL